MPTPATLYLSESNGAGEVVTDNITNLNFGGVDLVNVVPANHPVIRPNLITQFNSFFKAERIRIASLGDSILIQDLRVWKAAGTYVTGEQIALSLNGGVNTYTQPNQTSLITNGFSEIANPMSAVDPGANYLYTKAVGSHAAITAADGIPFYCPYIFFQWEGNVGGTTPFGAVNQKTIAFTYAES